MYVVSSLTQCFTYAPKNDPCLTMELYTRSAEQDLQLGISQVVLATILPCDVVVSCTQLALESVGEEKVDNDTVAPDEVLSPCKNCVCMCVVSKP